MVNRFPSLVDVHSIKKKLISIIANMVKRFKRPVNRPMVEEQVKLPFHYELPWNPNFPHEWQEDTNGCGAAAFSMVYKALGHPAQQKDIFKAVAVPDVATGEGFTCLTWLLYLDALKRGFHALHVQVINPIEMLKDCYEHAIKVVIHQRAGPSSTVGHCSVLIGIDDDLVYQHCPAQGPNQAFGHNEVLERMAPLGLSDVGLGNALTLIANPLTEKHTCKECKKEIPEFTPCPHCGKQIRLSPSEPLGCIDPECYGHKWIDIFCPYCMQGIRRLEDRKGTSIPAEDWQQTLKERQEKIEERKKRFSLFDLSKPLDGQPDEQPITK